uniref:DNA-replication helicase subunit n=1 Tax=Haslea pseudostrearia TaxID=197756 RepID=UPI0021FC5366|nr:DNA-replication helicase subunit [Haslea pseudostrearia]UXN44560.1 DNA-replication helicase subunit [Haslea pseudostrearia]
MQKSIKIHKLLLIEKYLPHNFLAEKMLLNCLLINSESVEMIILTLPVEAFYFQNHQEIYKSIIIMYKKKLPIDITTLVTFLQDNGLLKKIGGINVLIELINQIPNIIYVEEYIALLKDKFLRRSLIRLGYELINSSYMTNISIESVVNDFETRLFNLTIDLKPKQLSNSTELLNNILLELKEKSIRTILPGIASGFDDLDLITQGFQRADLIILAGRPSTGKTALSLNMGLNIIKSLKLPVIFFSLEMSKEQIMYRLLSIETKISQAKLRSGKLSENDWTKLNKILNIISKLPIFIDDTPNLSIQDIRSKIRTISFNESKIGLIIIDYLQLMQSSMLKSENRVQELSQITRALKNIAREFDVPVLTLSQLSRSVENRMDKKPILADLRESGSIEQDADLVLMLYQKTNLNVQYLNGLDNFLIELIIAKQRNGPIGNLTLKFNAKEIKFSNFN